MNGRKARRPAGNLFSVQFLELQVQGVKLGFKLGVLAGKVPDDQENAECNQGDPAKGQTPQVLFQAT